MFRYGGSYLSVKIVLDLQVNWKKPCSDGNRTKLHYNMLSSSIVGCGKNHYFPTTHREINETYCFTIQQVPHKVGRPGVLF